MQPVLETLDRLGGIHVAVFVFAMLSGVGFLASSEAVLIALGAASPYGVPKLIVLAAPVALGQSVNHALVVRRGDGHSRPHVGGQPPARAQPPLAVRDPDRDGAGQPDADPASGR